MDATKVGKKLGRDMRFVGEWGGAATEAGRIRAAKAMHGAHMRTHRKPRLVSVRHMSASDRSDAQRKSCQTWSRALRDRVHARVSWDRGWHAPRVVPPSTPTPISWPGSAPLRPKATTRQSRARARCSARSTRRCTASTGPAELAGESIVASHSLIPDALYHAFATFGALMSPDLPLERRQHEMIATMVSVTNRCQY